MNRCFAIATLVACALPLTAPASHAQMAAGNLLPNLSQWQLQHSGATTGSIASTKDWVEVEIRGADGMRNAAFEQTHVHLIIGHTYRFQTLISANTASQIQFGIVPSTGMHGAQIQPVAVSPSWSTLDMTYTAEGVGTNDVTVVFYLGSNSTVYRFAGATLVDADSAQAMAPMPAQTAAAPVPLAPQAHQGWGLELAGKAQAGTIESADGPIIMVDRPDDVAADVAFANENLDVANGRTYALHFRARSATGRSIGVEAQDMSPTHQSVGLSTDVKLTPSWQDYNLAFTAQDVSSGKARVALILGGQAGSIQLGDISFGAQAQAPAVVPVQAPARPTSGLVPVATWDLDTVGSATAMVSRSPNGALVEIDRADGAPAHVTLKQDGVALDDGKIYDLEFKAKASVSRRIPVIAQVDNGGVHLVGLNDSIHVTPEWQDFHLKFTAVQPIPAHSRIAFLLGGSSGTVELSDVALSPSDPTVTKVSASPPTE